MWRRHLTHTDGPSSESHALANANKDSASDEAAEVASWRKGLYKGSDDGEETANKHAPSSSQVIGLDTVHKSWSR